MLFDIIVIAVCAVVCGADGRVDMEAYGKSKHSWLKTFLALPDGIPSHDTFGRVFSLLDSKQFEHCFIDWISKLDELTAGSVVALDGKTLRHSFDQASKKSAIHMVGAWSSANRMVLGQIRVDDKSNEITAIPKLFFEDALKSGFEDVDPSVRGNGRRGSWKDRDPPPLDRLGHRPAGAKGTMEGFEKPCHGTVRCAPWPQRPARRPVSTSPVSRRSGSRILPGPYAVTGA